MPSQIIQWFPGHMAKTRRTIKEHMPLVDIVIEILDARIPYSSKNPELKRLIGNKPVITVFTKYSLADPNVSAIWKKYYSDNQNECVFVDCITGYGMNNISPAIKNVLSEKIAKYESKGMTGRQLKAMIVGIPNVGKSSIINKLAGNKKAKVENRPGVTKDIQWVTTKLGFDLLDTAGVLWPKFDERIVGENLAITGAIKDDILDSETIATVLCRRMMSLYPKEFCERFKLGDPELLKNTPDYEIFELVGRKRGLIVSGGEINYERTAMTLLDEFRSGKIGRITLEKPPVNSSGSKIAESKDTRDENA